VLDPVFKKAAVSSNGIFRPIIVIDGQIVGIWKHIQRKNSVSITFNFFRKLTNIESIVLNDTADQYGIFINKSIELNLIPSDEISAY
jgi:hypothetical protein